jgi:hypothetical protein
MLGACTLVAVLVLFHVGLVTVGAIQSTDFAWVPSYFDDDDGDFPPLLLAEQMPARFEPGHGWTPALVVLAAVVGWRPRSRPYQAATPARFRAPPVSSLLPR